MNLLFIDTETTGKETTDRLVELAYIEKDEQWKCINYSWRFKPPIPISIWAQATTHITNKMVADKIDFKSSEAYAPFQNRVWDSIVVAHNLKYDKQILENEWIKFNNKLICTMKVANYLYDIESYWLQYLRYYLDLDIDLDSLKLAPHSALADVIVLCKLFTVLVNELEERAFCSRNEAINIMIEISSNPITIRRMNFGKHKWIEIQKLDKDYVAWCRKNLNKAEHEDLFYTLDLHFKN